MSRDYFLWLSQMSQMLSLSTEEHSFNSKLSFLSWVKHSATVFISHLEVLGSLWLLWIVIPSSLAGDWLAAEPSFSSFSWGIPVTWPYSCFTSTPSMEPNKVQSEGGLNVTLTIRLLMHGKVSWARRAVQREVDGGRLVMSLQSVPEGCVLSWPTVSGQGESGVVNTSDLLDSLNLCKQGLNINRAIFCEEICSYKTVNGQNVLFMLAKIWLVLFFFSFFFLQEVGSIIGKVC